VSVYLNREQHDAARDGVRQQWLSP